MTMNTQQMLLTTDQQRYYDQAWESVVSLPGETSEHWKQRQQENKKRQQEDKSQNARRRETVIQYKHPTKVPEEYLYECEACTFEGTCLGFLDHLRERPGHQAVDRWGMVFEFGYYKYRRNSKHRHDAYDKAEEKARAGGARLSVRRPVEDRSAKTFDTVRLALHRSITEEIVILRNSKPRRVEMAVSSSFAKGEHSRLRKKRKQS
jgi:hypothetical protein